MFLRLLYESFARQRRRKLLAGLAILLGTTAVTAMLALATTIGDRIHQELAVYGANIVVTPKADQLAVKIGGVDIKPATGGAYLKESDLAKLKTIFWANNITGVSPELSFDIHTGVPAEVTAPALGLWFHHPFGTQTTGAPALHPWWKLNGSWPESSLQIALGAKIAQRLGYKPGQPFMITIPSADPDPKNADIALFTVTGIVSTGDDTENAILLPLDVAQAFVAPDAISRVDISAQTKPEDAFARQDPDTLTPAKREIWYCRPYANSIAYQIREAIPGADAQQVRKVEQSEGTVLERISGLMWLISAAALLAAGFAVSAAMATAVLERRGEIGLMRSLGASRTAIALLFYAENGLLAVVAGALGYLAGSALAYTLGAHIFSGASTTHALNPVLLPIVVALALIVAIAGSTPSIRAALRPRPIGHPPGGRMKLTLASIIRRSLIHRRSRSLSALTAMTVSAGVATALLTLYASLDAKLHHEFRSFGANIVVTAPANTLNLADKVKQAVGPDALTAPFAYAVATTDRGTPVVVAGVDFQQVRAIDSTWQADAWPTAPNAALVGQRAANFIADEHNLTLTFAGQKQTFPSAGHLKTGGDEDSRIYLPQPAFEALTGGQTHTTPTVVEVQIPGGAQQVEAALQRLRTQLPGLDVEPVRQLVEGESRIVDKTHALMFGAVLLIALTVGVSVLATLSASVLERRRDFALMKALGGTQLQMMALFLLETVLLASAGVATGWLLGSAAAWAISETNFHTATLPRPQVLPLVLLLNLAIAAMAALFPARALSTLEPASLLKGE